MASRARISSMYSEFRRAGNVPILPILGKLHCTTTNLTRTNLFQTVLFILVGQLWNSYLLLSVGAPIYYDITDWLNAAVAEESAKNPPGRPAAAAASKSSLSSSQEAKLTYLAPSLPKTQENGRGPLEKFRRLHGSSLDTWHFSLRYVNKATVNRLTVLPCIRGY